MPHDPPVGGGAVHWVLPYQITPRGSPGVVLRPAASASPGDLLEMEVLWLHLRPVESEVLGWPGRLCASTRPGNSAACLSLGASRFGPRCSDCGPRTSCLSITSGPVRCQDPQGSWGNSDLKEALKATGSQTCLTLVAAQESLIRFSWSVCGLGARVHGAPWVILIRSQGDGHQCRQQEGVGLWH